MKADDLKSKAYTSGGLPPKKRRVYYTGDPKMEIPNNRLPIKKRLMKRPIGDSVVPLVPPVATTAAAPASIDDVQEMRFNFKKKAYAFLETVNSQLEEESPLTPVPTAATAPPVAKRKAPPVASRQSSTSSGFSSSSDPEKGVEDLLNQTSEVHWRLEARYRKAPPVATATTEARMPDQTGVDLSSDNDSNDSYNTAGERKASFVVPQHTIPTLTRGKGKDIEALQAAYSQNKPEADVVLLASSPSSIAVATDHTPRVEISDELKTVIADTCQEVVNTSARKYQTVSIFNKTYVINELNDKIITALNPLTEGQVVKVEAAIYAFKKDNYIDLATFTSHSFDNSKSVTSCRGKMQSFLKGLTKIPIPIRVTLADGSKINVDITCPQQDERQP